MFKYTNTPLLFKIYIDNLLQVRHVGYANIKQVSGAFFGHQYVAFVTCTASCLCMDCFADYRQIHAKIKTHIFGCKEKHTYFQWFTMQIS